MLIIFDLDGTLTPQRSSSTAPFVRELLPGVFAKCKELVGARHDMAIATNQGGLRKGLIDGELYDILDWVCGGLGISHYRFATGVNPYRKKPQPGMLLEIMDQFDNAPRDTIFVGDADADQQAAEAAGITFCWADKFFA